MDLFRIIIYGLTAIVLGISVVKDTAKTKLALIRAFHSFVRILPGFLATLILMSTVLTFLPPSAIAGLIGERSGVWGVALAAVVGSIAVIPGFIVFPLASSLLDAGAGMLQVALLVSTLMTVGLLDIPIEAGYFGRRASLLRNSLAFAYAFITALTISLASLP